MVPWLLKLGHEFELIVCYDDKLYEYFYYNNLQIDS